MRSATLDGRDIQGLFPYTRRMDSCSRPHVEYPTRVPLKVIGDRGTLSPETIYDLIQRHLGPQPGVDQTPTSNQKGIYISYTFWITLPNETAELPLREAIQQLPGYRMQL